MGQRTTTGAALEENVGLPSSESASTSDAIDEHRCKWVSVQRLAPLLTRTAVCPASGSGYNDLRQKITSVCPCQRATNDVALDENFSLTSKWVSVQRLAPLVTRTSVCPANGQRTTTGAALEDDVDLPRKCVSSNVALDENGILLTRTSV